jgi:hypothetical protein
MKKAYIIVGLFLLLGLTSCGSKTTDNSSVKTKTPTKKIVTVDSK